MTAADAKDLPIHRSGVHTFLQKKTELKAKQSNKNKSLHSTFYRMVLTNTTAADMNHITTWFVYCDWKQACIYLASSLKKKEIR